MITKPLDDDTAIGTLPNGTQVFAASLVTGRKLLTTQDDFVSAQSQFDRQARVNLRQSVLTVSVDVYLDYVASQVMAWSSSEIESLKSIFQSIKVKFAEMNLLFPPNVYLVKTSGLEEGYAAYTRQNNVIALPANMVASLATAANYGDPLHPSSDTSYLEDVITHEFFHLFSKNNSKRRYEIYGLMHYRSTGNAVALPDTPWGPDGAGMTMASSKITNPDTPLLDVYIDMDVPTEPGSTTTVRRSLLPVLLAKSPYEGGLFFDYLQWWFMAIEKDPQGYFQPVYGSDGKPLMYESTPLLPQYMKLVGRNFHQEIFHPDEIAAQNFVLVANQPSLGFLVAMNGVLDQGRERSKD